MKTQYVLGNIGFSVAGAYSPGGLNALISPKHVPVDFRLSEKVIGPRLGEEMV